MNYHRFGSGTELGIFLLPGLFAGSWIWNKVQTALSAAGYSGIAIDAAFAEMVPAGDPLEYLQREVERIIVSSGFSHAVVCGNSLGGFLALKIQSDQNIPIAGCIASGAPGFGKTSDLGLTAKRVFSLLDAQRVADLLFVDASCVTQAQMTECLSHFKSRRSLLNIAQYMKTANKVDMAPLLQRIASPSLLVWGAQDKVTPLGDVPDLQAINRHLTIEVIEHCGHSPMIEKPTHFVKAMESYLESLPLAALA
ncbi:alpha/beta fold hydrolase [Paludibacterium purpuratum]|uniref:Pimeloyl-ACP methyl ester carboxylesterase n=1 Tax=Paludibacterium purpuratum TaxID=1144873 RepID=A0A4V3DVM5_9NEIS|nr:alpha/beta fold hydrolase [Paludibacterium purpuratum]TDR81549.1 pimeloyl-ACP methyl ester carboxylesterase [Paludibacterium purpuratum]